MFCFVYSCRRWGGDLENGRVSEGRKGSREEGRKGGWLMIYERSYFLSLLGFIFTKFMCVYQYYTSSSRHGIEFMKENIREIYLHIYGLL